MDEDSLQISRMEKWCFEIADECLAARGLLVDETRVFSSEVETGSRQENASNRESGAPFRFNRNGNGSSRRVLAGAVAAALQRVSLTLASLSKGDTPSANFFSVVGPASQSSAVSRQPVAFKQLVDGS
jgi:hypothetical protein